MFERYYKMPLIPDGYGVYVWTHNHKMALDWIADIDEFDKERIVEQVNYPIAAEWEYEKAFEYDGNGNILYNTHPLLRVRGWGMLTGVGGYNLSAKDAARIQDEFATFIVEQLNRFSKE